MDVLLDMAALYLGIGPRAHAMTWQDPAPVGRGVVHKGEGPPSRRVECKTGGMGATARIADGSFESTLERQHEDAVRSSFAGRISTITDKGSADKGGAYKNIASKSNADKSSADFTAKTPAISRFHPLHHRKILVLDLDETLIHSTVRSQTLSMRPALQVEININQHPCVYYVYKRPYVDHFLQVVDRWFQVAIYTASMATYANPVIDHLERSSGIVIPPERRFFRESCTITMNGRLFLKDLVAIVASSMASQQHPSVPFSVGMEGGIPRDEDPLKHTILVDNSLMSFGLQPRNGVPIEGWICDPYDEGLLDCLVLLDGLRFVDDVRSILSLRVDV